MQLDGASLALWRDPHKVAAELRHFSRRDADAYLKLFEIIDAAVQMGLPAMQTNPTRPEAKAVLKSLSKAGRHAGKIGEVARSAASSQTEAVEEHFETDIIKAALMIGLPFMSYHADGSGWALIYLGVLSKYGVAMFEGARGAFPKALVSCLQDHGGTVRTSAKVESLIMRGDRVAGVRLAGGEGLLARRGVLTAFSPKQRGSAACRVRTPPRPCSSSSRRRTGTPASMRAPRHAHGSTRSRPRRHRTSTVRVWSPSHRPRLEDHRQRQGRAFRREPEAYPRQRLTSGPQPSGSPICFARLSRGEIAAPHVVMAGVLRDTWAEVPPD